MQIYEASLCLLHIFEVCMETQSQKIHSIREDVRKPKSERMSNLLKAIEIAAMEWETEFKKVELNDGSWT